MQFTLPAIMQDILRTEEYLTHLAYLLEEGISLTNDLDAIQTLS